MNLKCCIAGFQQSLVCSVGSLKNQLGFSSKFPGIGE